VKYPGSDRAYHDREQKIRNDERTERIRRNQKKNGREEMSKGRGRRLMYRSRGKHGRRRRYKGDPGITASASGHSRLEKALGVKEKEKRITNHPKRPNRGGKKKTEGPTQPKKKTQQQEPPQKTEKKKTKKTPTPQRNPPKKTPKKKTPQTTEWARRVIKSGFRQHVRDYLCTHKDGGGEEELTQRSIFLPGPSRAEGCQRGFAADRGR